MSVPELFKFDIIFFSTLCVLQLFKDSREPDKRKITKNRLGLIFTIAIHNYSGERSYRTILPKL